MSAFQTGSTYMMRSPCDYDCIWEFEVVARTAATVTLSDRHDRPKKCRIRSFDGVETCKPLGSYSMAPILSADRQVQS